MSGKLTFISNNKFISEAKNIGLSPFYLLIILSIFHVLFVNYGEKFAGYLFSSNKINDIEYYIYSCIMILTVYWLFSRVIDGIKNILSKSSFFINHSISSVFISFFARMLKALIFLSIFNFLAQNIPGASSYLINKITSILIIICISSFLFKLVDISDILLTRYYEDFSGTIAARKMFTKTLILKRVVYSVLTAVSIGAILILFDNVRALGASVLTTAGVLGLVVTFTAQRSLGSILSGLEIALTQPIKIGDAVVIDNEQGVIEEINFRNVVIKLWDWRRLIVPTNYFLEKPFQNWSREQNSNLIGGITLYVDFTLPVNSIRDELTSILNTSKFWDKNIGKLNVSDLKEHVMEIKILASARNINEVGELKNEIREKLISYIAKHYPQCLPNTRSYSIKSEGVDSLNLRKRLFEETH